jgi:nucleoside-diphosphate-sugar epimerase
VSEEAVATARSVIPGSHSLDSTSSGDSLDARHVSDCDPVFLFADAQRQAEERVETLCRRNGIEFVVLRLGWLLGGGEALFTAQLAWLVHSGVLCFRVSGARARAARLSLTHVRDAVQAVATAADPALAITALNETYHVCADPASALTVDAWVELLSRSLARRPPRFSLPAPIAAVTLPLLAWIARLLGSDARSFAERVRGRTHARVFAADPRLPSVVLTQHRVYDNTKARTRLGWRPTMSPEAAVRLSVRTMREEGLCETGFLDPLAPLHVVLIAVLCALVYVLARRCGVVL